MDINNHILWFKKQPKWIQYAAKRLLELGEIDVHSVDELVKICIEEAAGNVQDFESEFPSKDFRTETEDLLRICSIGDVHNINALAPKSPLKFGESNLSIIYGLNGSGKSGYVRILKHASGSRNSGTLHSNIYSSEENAQRCSISYEKGGSVKEISWEANSGIIEDLIDVDIFDESIGQVYITTENETTYEPPELLFFSNLIQICGKVSNIIDAKLSKFVSKLPIIPFAYIPTEYGKWYVNFSKDITSNDIVNHCAWNDENDKKLVEIEKRLSEQSPNEKAKNIRLKKNYTDTLIKETIYFLSKLSDENCNLILTAKENSKIKKNVAKAAADVIFKSAPLDGVGSDIWKLLWEQARKYSQEEAYKEITFPYTGDDARCVLCHEKLSVEGKSRIISFEEFVKGKVQEAADAAKISFDNLLKDIGDLPSVDILRTKVEAAGLTEVDNASILVDTYEALRNRMDQLLNVDSVEKMDSIPQIEDWTSKAQGQSQVYDELSQRYEEDAKADNRTDLELKRDELKVKKWLAEQSNSIKDEVKRLKRVDEIKTAILLTDTTNLSKKKSKLSEKLITEVFVKRFNDELKILGANWIKIELVKTRVEKGHVLHRLQMRGASKNTPVDVLSEGEHRIVSIAVILADATIKQNSAPFVFDDPISSLDLNFEEAVAARLVNLSKNRQVIVFTHRLSLLGLLQEYSKKSEITPHIVCVRREIWGSGEPGGTPLFAKKPVSALNFLLNESLPKALKVLNEEGSEQYTPYADSICKNYRIILERMIENVLMADVVKRDRRAVNTQGKIEKLARITDADCSYFDNMMTKYSRYEHSQSDEAPVEVPNPDELQEDMETLRRWHEEFVIRGGQ